MRRQLGKIIDAAGKLRGILLNSRTATATIGIFFAFLFCVKPELALSASCVALVTGAGFGALEALNVGRRYLPRLTGATVGIAALWCAVAAPLRMTAAGWSALWAVALGVTLIGFSLNFRHARPIDGVVNAALGMAAIVLGVIFLFRLESLPYADAALDYALFFGATALTACRPAWKK